MDFYFKRAITSSSITSGHLSSRFYPRGFVFDHASASFFVSSKLNLFNILGLMNSNTFEYIVDCINPTINTGSEVMEKIPFIRHTLFKSKIKNLSQNNISFAKADWDSFETSWDFKTHPFLTHIAEHKQNWTLESAYDQWEKEALDRFNHLKANEEELNRIFIDLYSLQDELTPEEEDKDVSVRKADKEKDVKSFLSYFIGCVFGRYSLDTPGLAYAGGEWDSTKYQTFVPNQDNVILLTDADYFHDQRDIINRLKEFLIATFGKNSLYKNLDFIGSVLDQNKFDKGFESQQIIRDYFLNDFYKKDHLKIYQKRPIYWELNSGKAKGFKALFYVHRYDADTMAMIRSGYLHELQDAYENTLQMRLGQLDNETDKKIVKKLDKEINNLKKQITEVVKFDQDLQHIASQAIKIDLDDGVIVNHSKVQADSRILTPIK